MDKLRSVAGNIITDVMGSCNFEDVTSTEKGAQCKSAVLMAQKANSHWSSDALDQLLASVSKFVSET